MRAAVSAARTCTPEVAESADADHDGGAAGAELAQRAADGVVRRERRVGQRGGVTTGSRPSGSGTRWRAAGHQQVVGHAAVEARARHRRRARSEVGALAVGLQAGAAVLRSVPQPQAPTTATGWPGSSPVTPSPSGVHPAGVLVAEGERRVQGSMPGLELVHQVQVGVAGAGAADLDQHLARARLGDGDLLEDRLALPLVQTQCAHVDLLGLTSSLLRATPSQQGPLPCPRGPTALRATPAPAKSGGTGTVRGGRHDRAPHHRTRTPDRRRGRTRGGGVGARLRRLRGGPGRVRAAPGARRRRHPDPGRPRPDPGGRRRGLGRRAPGRGGQGRRRPRRRRGARHPGARPREPRWARSSRSAGRHGWSCWSTGTCPGCRGS